MAVLKVYAVRHHMHRIVDYAANEEKTSIDSMIGYAADPDKTEQQLFETAISLSSVDNAYAEMTATKEKYGKRGGVLAYHYIQSFKPDEVTPELAHQIGVELANECFGDRFEAVVATHLDRRHLHNHIVVNSVSFADGGKLRSTPKDYYRIREISDRLCREHNLSVIAQTSNRAMHYGEWRALNEGKPTIRGQMRAELDAIVSQSKTMLQFYELLRKNGYQIRSGNRKYTAVKPPYSERYIRLKSLGDEYTEESINERIIAARNGIRMTPPSTEVKRYSYKGKTTQIRRKKLKGFMALYFHYLYLFKKIRRRQALKKVSAFLREELTRLERYQKQFRYMYDNGIETMEQLEAVRTENEDKINALVNERKELYGKRQKADEAVKAELSKRIYDTNAALRKCRSNIRMCASIAEDAQRIAEKQRQTRGIAAQDKEVKKHEHKRRGR